MRILGVRKLSDEKWLNLYEATYENDGRQGRWVYASRREQDKKGPPTPDAVVIVPLLRRPGDEPLLVLQKEYRIPLGMPNYAFPAGLVDPGESVETTIRRELLEESGLELTAIKTISPHLTTSAGLTDESIVMAYVDVRAPAGEMKQQLEHSEEIETLLLDFDATCNLCDQPDLSVDAKAWVVLYHYKLLGRLE